MTHRQLTPAHGCSREKTVEQTNSEDKYTYEGWLNYDGQTPSEH